MSPVEDLVSGTPANLQICDLNTALLLSVVLTLRLFVMEHYCGCVSWETSVSIPRGPACNSVFSLCQLQPSFTVCRLLLCEHICSHSLLLLNNVQRLPTTYRVTHLHSHFDAESPAQYGLSSISGFNSLSFPT